MTNKNTVTGKECKYTTSVYSEGLKINEIPKTAKIGEVSFTSGTCPHCSPKMNAVKEFNGIGWILKSKKCSCKRKIL